MWSKLVYCCLVGNPHKIGISETLGVSWGALPGAELTAKTWITGLTEETRPNVSSKKAGGINRDTHMEVYAMCADYQV